MVNNKQKGKRVERNIVNWLKDLGVNAARSVQYCGKNGDSDVVSSDLPSFHIEVKGTQSKKLNKSTLLKWHTQIETDVKNNNLPVIFHIANGEEPVALIPVFTTLAMGFYLMDIKTLTGDAFEPSEIICNMLLDRKIQNLFTREIFLGLPLAALPIKEDKVFLATDGKRFVSEMLKYEKSIRVA